MKSKVQNLTDRLDWIDIAKGIGIISMLIGHNITQLQPIIYAFHMPLFFILAGYTIKKIEKENLIKVTLKDFKRLIIPCIITRVIILIGNCLLNGSSFKHELFVLIASLLWGNRNGTLFGLALPTIGRIWFLPALFWTKLFFRIIMLLFEEKSRIYILLPLSLVSMFAGMHGIILPQSFDMLFVCMLFVEIGVILRNIDITRIKWWIVVFAFAIWSYLSCSQNIWISMSMREYPGYGLCIVVAIAGCICVFLFSQAIAGSFISRPLVYYGKYSMVLLAIEAMSPYFYRAQTLLQSILCMSVECLLVVLYIFMKEIIVKILKKVI